MAEPEQVEIVERKTRLVIDSTKEESDFKIFYGTRRVNQRIVHCPQYAVSYQEIAAVLSGDKETIGEAYRFTTADQDLVMPINGRDVLARITERIIRESRERNYDFAEQAMAFDKRFHENALARVALGEAE